MLRQAQHDYEFRRGFRTQIIETKTMLKFIIVFILSLIITQVLNVLFGSQKHEENVREVAYEVKAKEGIIGCLSKEKFIEAANHYKNKEFEAIKKMLDDEACFLFKNGEKLTAPSDTCSKKDSDDELFPFKTSRLILLQPYLPCFAVIPN